MPDFIPPPAILEQLDDRPSLAVAVTRARLQVTVQRQVEFRIRFVGQQVRIMQQALDMEILKETAKGNW